MNILATGPMAPAHLGHPQSAPDAEPSGTGSHVPTVATANSAVARTSLPRVKGRLWQAGVVVGKHGRSGRNASVATAQQSGAKE